MFTKKHETRRKIMVIDDQINVFIENNTSMEYIKKQLIKLINAVNQRRCQEILDNCREIIKEVEKGGGN